MYPRANVGHANRGLAKSKQLLKTMSKRAWAK